MDSTDIALLAVAATATAVAVGAAGIHAAATARSSRWRIRAARITSRRWRQQ